MENSLLERYASLLVNYSLDLKEKEHLLIRTTTLAEDLVREIYRAAVKKGAVVSVDFSFRAQSKIFLDEANDWQLGFISPASKRAIETCDAYPSRHWYPRRQGCH